MSNSKILIIEDEASFRELFTDILTSEGYIVAIAEDGKAALDSVKNEDFDLVITDMVLTEWDGIRTMEEIKKVVPDQDIIIVTHVSEIETAVEAMKSGASDYILKPVNRENLLYSIRRLLKKQKVLAEHSKLIEESVEHFEILSIYNKCIGILSINDYQRLINNVTESMAFETGAGEAYFWSWNETDKKIWKIDAATVGDEKIRKKKLPLSETWWREGLAEGIPFNGRGDDSSSLYVPLMLHGGKVVVVELSAKKGGRSFDDKDARFAGMVAEFSQLALSNAGKILSLQEKALTDEVFHVYSYSFFKDYFNKQLFTAKRYRRPFSSVILRMDNIAELKKAYGPENVRRSLIKICEKVSGLIRQSDIFARRVDDEFFLLLPETDYFGSIMALKRVEEAIAGVKYVSDGISSSPVNVLLVSASFPRDGNNMKSLIGTLKSRCAELRGNNFLTLNLGEKGYWESVEVILKNSENPKFSEGTETKGPSSMAAPYLYSTFDSAYYSRLKNVFADEITMRPFLRGVLFVGMDTLSPKDEFCKKIGRSKNLSMRTFVIGTKGKELWNIPNITPVYLKEGEKPMDMILFLNEEAGYAFFSDKNGKDGITFHTSDIYTVEKMISKLRDHYLLQWL